MGELLHKGMLDEGLLDKSTQWRPESPFFRCSPFSAYLHQFGREMLDPLLRRAPATVHVHRDGGEGEAWHQVLLLARRHAVTKVTCLPHVF